MRPDLVGDAPFRLMVESVKDYAIIMLDDTGHVATWNAGAERIKGYTAAEIVGRSFSVFYPDELIAEGFPQHELDVAAREGRFEDEGWRVRKDGSRFWANVIITALHDDDGKLVGFGKVTRDLTERREAERQARIAEAEARRAADLAELNAELQEQAGQLEEQQEELQSLMEELAAANADLEHSLQDAHDARARAEQAREAVAEAYRDLDQFAYVASHDLKAPLRGIANLAEWIREDAGDALPAESREHMDMLHGRVLRMEALIDGILAYSRAGRLREPPTSVDSSAIVAEAVELIGAPPEVTIEIADDMPIIQANRVPFQQVMLNLISNAVKHGCAHRPDVRVCVGWRDLGAEHEFTVTDNGPGIAPEYHDRIWGVFQMLEARDRVEGTGIGLSVVKKIVEMRGGRVWVESSPGEGATFGFSWPKEYRNRGYA